MNVIADVRVPDSYTHASVHELQHWCPKGDSNPHDLRRYHLKVVRLPIPPSGQCCDSVVLHLRSRAIVKDDEWKSYLFDADRAPSESNVRAHQSSSLTRTPFHVRQHERAWMHHAREKTLSASLRCRLGRSCGGSRRWLYGLGRNRLRRRGRNSLRGRFYTGCRRHCGRLRICFRN